MDLSTILGPLKYISLLIPIFPIDFGQNGNEFNLRDHKIINYIQLAVPIVFVLVSTVYRQILAKLSAYQGIIVRAVEFFQYNSQILITIFCILMTRYQGARIKRFFKTALEIDKKFNKLGQKTDYTELRKLSLLCIWFNCLKILLQQIPLVTESIYKWNIVRILDHLILNVTLILINILLTQWIISLNLLKIHWAKLNNLIKHYKYGQCWLVQDLIKPNGNKPKNSRDLLKICGILYDSLCTQSVRINQAFAWQILVLIPSLFLLIIFSSYQLCEMIKNKNNFQFDILIYNCLYFVVFLELIIPCVLVKEKAGKFIQVLHKIDLGPDNEDTMNSLILQTYHQQIEFSACGVFPLDGTLMYSIFGALTTYLVILLQFEL